MEKIICDNVLIQGRQCRSGCEGYHFRSILLELYPGILYLFHPSIIGDWVERAQYDQCQLWRYSHIKQINITQPQILIYHSNHYKSAIFFDCLEDSLKYFEYSIFGTIDLFIIRIMEELSLQIKGELQQMFKVLSKDEHDKMPFEGIQIAKTLSRIPLIRRFFDANSEHFINMCIAQDVITCLQNQKIYKREGEEGKQRYIYVVIEGKIQLSSNESAKREIGMLRIFGQTEILFGLENRKEIAVAIEQTKLMRIKQSAILRLFAKRDDIKKILHFMKVNQYFQCLSQLQKMQLSLSMVKKTFEKGSILKIDGQKLEQVLFFIYGRVQVITSIQKKQKQKQFVIDYLEEMSSFGQFQSSQKIGTDIKLRGTVSGAFYSVNYTEMKREAHKIAQIIQGNAVPYPTKQQLQFLQGVKSSVKKQENKISSKLFSFHR